MTTPTLAGHGIRMEPAAEHHLPELRRIACAADIWRYMVTWVESERDVEIWLQKAMLEDRSTNTCVWIICLDSGEVIGSTRLFDIHLDHRTAEVGHTWITSAWRGKGINPRVKYLQLSHAFDAMQLRRIALKTHHGNLQSQAAMLKLGATFEGTFRNHMIMPDGSARHSRWYSILAEEWPQVQASLRQRIARQVLDVTGPEQRT